MSVYPGAIDSFQSKDNLPGETYDSTDHVTVWAENFNDLNDAVVAVEDTLGTNPQGSDVSVEARLARLENNWQNAFPVGCIYISTSDTDPATTLGFGTWSAVSAGRVLVGVAGSGTFDTPGATGGEETHLLTSSESGLPAHHHPPGSLANYLTTGTSTLIGTSAGSSIYQAQSNPANTGNNTAANASSAHNNLQPYLVVYMWERTA